MPNNFYNHKTRQPDPTRPSRLFRYGVAVLDIIGATLAVNYLPVIGEWGRGAFLLYFFATIMVTLWLGLYPGLLSLILSLIGINLFLLVPIWHSDPYDALFLNTGFCILSSIMIILIQYYHRQNQFLLESQQDLSLAQEVAQVGSWRFKVKGDELYWTDEKYRIFEVAMGTKITMDTFLSAIHPEDREYVDRMWQASLRGEPYDIEHRIIVSGNKVKWIREKAILEFTKAGALLGGFGTTQDITERKKSDQEIQALVERYELVLNGAQDAIWDWDVPNKRVNYSSRWKAMRGYAEDEIGTDEAEWAANIHLDDKNRIMSAVQDHFDGITPLFCEEYRILCKDGTWKWILDRGIAKKDASGRVVRMAGSESDITDRKLAQQELLDREKKLQLIMDLTPNLICYLSTDFRYIQINKTYQSWWHKKPEQILDQHVSEIVGDQVWMDIKPYLQEARSGQTVSFEYHNPSGRWVHVDYVPDMASSGEVKGIVVNVANITEHKLAEQQLIDQENQLNLIMNLAPALISYLDADLRYVRANKAYENWYGVSVKDIIGRKVSEIVHEKTWAIAQPFLERTLQGERVDFEEIVFKQGDARWVNITFVPDLDKSGNVKGIVVHVADITNQKNHELALIEKENALRLIINAMPALISYVDTSYHYVRVNETYKNWLGITVENIIGQEIKTIVGEVAWQTIQPYMEKAMSGEQVHYELKITYKTGKPRWIHANLVPDKDSDGHVKGVVALVVDIGDIKQAEFEIASLNETLKNRIEEMEAIFNTAPVGLSITNDLEGKHIRGNKALETIMGLPRRSELSFRTIPEQTYRVLSNGNLLSIDELPMQRAIRGETVTNQVLDIHIPDGKVVSLNSNAVPLFDEHNNVRGAIGAFQDITTLRNAETALRDSEERLRLAQKAGNLGIFDQDLISGEMHWDMRLRELWGITSDAPLFTDICMASVHPEDRAHVYASVNRSFNPQGNGDYHAEYRIIHPTDGRVFWLAAFGTTTFDNNRPTRMVGFVQDISERKRTELALRDTEARLSLAVKELKAGYWDWNIYTNEVFFSPEWKQQLGYTETEVPNRFDEWEIRLHPDDKANAMMTVENYLNGKLPTFELEFRLQHKDGSYRWIHSRAALMQDHNMQQRRLVGIHLDITDYKTTKELNQQRDQMEEAFRLYVATQTVAAIAHELNQPLTAIAYYSDAAVDMVKSGNQNPQKLSRVLENCSLQAQRAGQVIRQLFSVLQKGETQNEAVDINKLVDYAYEYIKINYQLDSFSLVLNLATGLPLVLANILQIQKILINLFHNSMEAMHESGNNPGTISIMTCLSPNDPSMAQITVKDTGVGVPNANNLSKMFQPFYTTKPTGLGMGLAISRSLIEAHGGKMWAEQNADTGISVHFTLPFML